MLKAVSKVAEELGKECSPENFDLGKITKMFEAITVIDRVVFVRYDTPPENPIWGEFVRWSRQPSVYASFETIVEVRYASHLLESEDWLRLVVCKELCHALEAPSGQHDVSERAIDDLVDKFSLWSAEKRFDKISRAYHLEMLAEVAAIEILCPLKTRKAILAERGPLQDGDCDEIAKKFNIPVSYVSPAFEAEHIEVIESLIAD